MKQLTVRGVPDDLSRALMEERKRRGRSLNATLIDLLRRALGLTPDSRYDNGLGALAGSWDEAQHSEFQRNTDHLRGIDEEIWR